MDLRDDDEYDRWSIAAWVVVMCLSGAAGIVAAAWVVVMCLSGAAGIVAAAMWWGAR